MYKDQNFLVVYLTDCNMHFLLSAKKHGEGYYNAYVNTSD